MIDRPRIYRGANQRKNSTKKGGKRKRVERGNAHHADERSEIHFRADSSGRLTELRKPYSFLNTRKGGGEGAGDLTY